MSEENVEIVRNMQEAFNRGDYAESLAALAEDVEWHAPPGLSIGEAVYRGHEEVERGFALWLDAWETYRFEPTELIEHGDNVVVIGNQTARGRGSGVEVTLQTFHVYTLRNARITHMRTFDDREEALEAAGLSE